MTAKHNNYKGNQNKNYQQGGQNHQHNKPQQQQKKALTPAEVKQAFVRPEEEGKIKGLVVTQQKLQAAIAKSINNLLDMRDGCMGVYLEQDRNIKDDNYKWKFKIIVAANSPMFQSDVRKNSGRTNSMQAYLQNISKSTKVTLSEEYLDLVRYLEYYNPYDKRSRDYRERNENSRVIYVDATRKIGGKDYHVITVDFFKILALLLQVGYDSIKIHAVDTVPAPKKKKSKSRGVQTAFALVINDDEYEEEIDATEVPEEVIENIVKTVSRDIVGVDYNGEDDDTLFDDEDDEDDDFED